MQRSAEYAGKNARLNTCWKIKMQFRKTPVCIVYTNVLQMIGLRCYFLSEVGYILRNTNAACSSEQGLITITVVLFRHKFFSGFHLWSGAFPATCWSVVKDARKLLLYIKVWLFVAIINVVSSYCILCLVCFIIKANLKMFSIYQTT